MFSRLFRPEPRPACASPECQALVQGLNVSDSSATTTEHLRTCLREVMVSLDGPTSTAVERNDVIAGLLEADLPLIMLEALPRLEFEAAKDSMRLFDQILKLGTSPVANYISCHKQILCMLLDGCGNADVGLQSNAMLRSCTRRSELVELLFKADFATGLISLVEHHNFDISSDAFCSLRALLTGCKPAAARYIEENSALFFGAYHKLLDSDDYFTKRQALCLLADVLLDPDFEQVMSSYAKNDKFLKVNMNLLRDTSKAIQSDAFRVFSIFVSEAQEAPRVHQILFKNKDRLVRLLESGGKEGSDSLVRERQAAVEVLQDLEVPLPRPRTSSESPSASSVDSPTNDQTNACEQLVLKDCALNFIQWQHSVY